MLSKKEQRKIASERITILFQEAKKKFKKNPSLSDRYVVLARKLSMKYKVPFKKEYKKLFCKKCYKFLQPGKTLRTRVKHKVLIFHCNNCGFIKRYPFK